MGIYLSCDSHALFESLKIAGTAGYEEKLNKYNVIKIDLNSEYQNTLKKEQLIQKLTGKIRNELKAVYADISFSEEDSLADYIGGLLFVGVSYDEKTKTHECRIVNFEKKEKTKQTN